MPTPDTVNAAVIECSHSVDHAMMFSTLRTACLGFFGAEIQYITPQDEHAFWRCGCGNLKIIPYSGAGYTFPSPCHSMHRSVAL